jgi:hypothetical protein
VFCILTVVTASALVCLFYLLLITLVILLIAQKAYPHPKELEVSYPELSTDKMNQLFWIYLIGSALVAAGYADFPLMAYHFEKASVNSTNKCNRLIIAFLFGF